MRNTRSVWRGLRAMHKTTATPPAGWTVRFGRFGFWADWWTPIWHEGRGPYISIGLGFIAIYRGY